MEARMKLHKIGGGGGGGEVGGAIIVAPSPNHSRRGSSGRPSWLLFTIADLDERMKMLTINVSEDDNADSFAKRAEDYYQRRPQLLVLLQDLYNAYLSLADRYCQALAKNPHHRRYSSPISPFHFNENDQFDEEDSGDVIDSDDAASSLSYQTPFLPPAAVLDADMIVADLVMKSVDYEIILNELSIVERRSGNFSRKVELQKSLLEVLESERLILLNENAGLAYRVNALLEENKGLASESLIMKRKASDLARCVLKTREDHRVCLLSRKIQDLQGQIYGLEKRNKEYYNQLVKHEEKKSKAKVAKSKSSAEVNLEDCFHVHEDVACFGTSSSTLANMKKGCLPTNGSIGRGKRALKLWDRVKKFDIFQCVPHVNSTYC